MNTIWNPNNLLLPCNGRGCCSWYKKKSFAICPAELYEPPSLSGSP